MIGNQTALILQGVTTQEKYSVDLYIPGNPAHPLSIINGLLDLLGKK